MSRSALVVVAGASIASPGAAQLARPRAAQADAPKLLVVPFNREGRDSVLSLLVADAVRERLRTAHATRFNTLSRQNINANLTESGFPIDVPLEPAVVRQLARFLNARYVVEGWMVRTGRDSLRVTARLSEAAGQQPQSASVAVMQQVARISNGTGTELANLIARAHGAFEDVTQCRRFLEEGNFARALQKAQDAIREYAGSSGAWLCIAQVRRAQRAPADSILVALRRAADVDSLNTLVLRQLAALYEQQNDTANLVLALGRILRLERDPDLRIRTIRLLVGMGQTDSAIALAREGLAGNIINVELMQALSIAYGASRQWDSAAATLAHVAEVDSNALDSAFVYRITQYYQAAGDSAGLLTWYRRATLRLPGQLDYWYALAALELVRGDTAQALTAMQGLFSRLPDSTDQAAFEVTRSLRARASILRATLLASSQPDSAVRYATTAVLADSMLRGSAAGVWLRAGFRAYQDSSYATAAERFQRARALATTRQVSVPASFFLGVSQYRLAVAADGEAETSRACEPAQRALRLWDEVERNITDGAPQNRDLANQILTQAVPAYRQRATAFSQRFCR